MVTSPDGPPPGVNLEIDAQKVYQRLGGKIASLEAENAQLNELVQNLGEQLSEALKVVNASGKDKTPSPQN